MGPGVLPELEVVSKRQGSVPLEKMATFEGDLFGITSPLTTRFPQALLTPGSVPKSPAVSQHIVGNGTGVSKLGQHLPENVMGIK